MLVLEHIFGDESPECLQEDIFLWKVLRWLKKKKSNIGSHFECVEGMPD